MKITVVGTGYVGLSLAVLLASGHEVVALDVDSRKVGLINSGKPVFTDEIIAKRLASGKLNIRATTDYGECKGSDVVILAVPTNYDPDRNYFDTSILDSAIGLVVSHGCRNIVIKSTIPVGYTKKASKRFGVDVLFSPEFLREGCSMQDCLHPSRIIVGLPSENEHSRKLAETFVSLLRDSSDEKDVPTMIIDSDEAECVKLFANTYLAMRVSYFNELDSYATAKGLSSRNIIKGVCYDKRIGDFYNNPSFGYGGYCLPKDVKQLRAEFNDVPNSLIKAIVESNSIRKLTVAKEVAAEIGNDGTVGIYRLSMKKGSDNHRNSSVIGVMKRLATIGLKTVIYEPNLDDAIFMGSTVIKDFDEFVEISDIIICNRMDDRLKDVKKKIYTKDKFGYE